MIANVLMDKRNLRSLALAKNSISKDGALSLVQLLKANPSITELNLANNAVG